MKNTFQKNSFGSLLVAVFTAFTICIYAPLSIYCANSGEYWYTLRLIWYVPVITFLAVTTALFLVSFFTHGLIHDTIIGAQFGLGLCFYLQGNFLKLTVGIFDGSHIDWGVYRGRMIVNILIWIVIIVASAVAYIFKPVIAGKVGKYISALLTAMQLVSLVFLIVPVIGKQGWKLSAVPSFTTEGMNEVGDDNIIVIIVDVLDEMYVDYALREIPDINNVFDGFEFYDNFTSEYRCTGYSVPSNFVIGKSYYNEKDHDEWTEENGSNRLYFDELADNDYEISIYTEEVHCYPSRVRKMATNYKEINKQFYNARTCFSVLYRSAGCVYFPDIVKPYIWLDDERIADTATTDSTYTPFDARNSFFKDEIAKNGLTVRNDTKQFKMVHIRGIHEPFYTDEYGNETDEHWDWEVTTRGCIKILDEYFALLKEQGVYDDSVIIVTGDHGYHHTMGVLSNPGFLIKYKNSHGEVIRNHNEAGLVNFCATIADLAGTEDTSSYGLSILDIDENTSFDRYFYTFVCNNDGTVETPCLLEYITPVDTNDVKQYKLTGIEYTEDGKKIDHYANCVTCEEHAQPKIEDDFHVVDKHRHARDNY